MSYLAVGALIKSKLNLLNNYRVYAARDVDMGKAKAQKAPCIFVSYGGEASVERHGKAALITQTWIVLVAVANEKNNVSGDKANADAGEILGDVIPALIGWIPETGYTPLELVSSPIPHGYDDKFLYYPIAFNTTIRITGDNYGC